MRSARCPAPRSAWASARWTFGVGLGVDCEALGAAWAGAWVAAWASASDRAWAWASGVGFGVGLGVGLGVGFGVGVGLGPIVTVGPSIDDV